MNRPANLEKKLIIFDMDGTLYRFREGSFRKSRLRKQILQNARKFIQKKLQVNDDMLDTIWRSIEEKYGEAISIALEKQYMIDRHEYFQSAWNIQPEQFIKKYSGLKTLLMHIGRREELKESLLFRRRGIQSISAIDVKARVDERYQEAVKATSEVYIRSRGADVLLNPGRDYAELPGARGMSARDIITRLPAGSTMLDVGCGSGQLGADILGTGGTKDLPINKSPYALDR